MCFSEAIRLDSCNSEFYFGKGLVYDCLNKSLEAIACYDECLKLNRKFVDAYTFKGCGLIKIGRFQEAFHCFEAALDLDPNDSLAIFNKNLFF